MNNDVFIIGEGFYLAFFFSSFNFTPFFIVIEMVDCFFHYIISYSFLRCLSEDNWDAAKPPKKIGQERITITKRKRKKKRKEYQKGSPNSGAHQMWGSSLLCHRPPCWLRSSHTHLSTSSFHDYYPFLSTILSLSLLFTQSSHHYFLQTGYLMQWCPAHRCHKRA